MWCWSCNHIPTKIVNGLVREPLKKKKTYTTIHPNIHYIIGRTFLLLFGMLYSLTKLYNANDINIENDHQITNTLVIKCVITFYLNKKIWIFIFFSTLNKQKIIFFLKKKKNKIISTNESAWSSEKYIQKIECEKKNSV